MVFSGLTFLLLFLPALLILYFLSRDLRWRNGVLVVFSLIFYAWGEPVMVLLLIGTTLFNYLIARAMDRANSAAGKRLCLVLGVIGSLAGLLYFKYAGFFLTTLSDLFGFRLSFNAPRLPIGISFYTFQILTYTVDVYRGKTAVQKSFFRLLLYVSCFPQLIAGPIVQYADVAAALEERTTTLEDFGDGMRRFLLGLGKKVLLANTCGSFLLAVLPAGAAPQSIGGAWLSGACTPCSSTSTSLPTPTWPSASGGCWASPTRRTSSTPTAPPPPRTSGAGGTSRWAASSGTTCTSPWGAAAGARAGGC